VELPGEMSIQYGVALAQRGFRPVPLFNCATGAPAAIPWEALVHHLKAAAPELSKASLPTDAPPAFLLDSRRVRPSLAPVPGTFDNRWVVFPQDFPSAGFLKSRGIRTILILQEFAGAKPQDDLAHVLVRWQEAGLELKSAAISDVAQQLPITAQKPSFFRALFYRIGVAVGLRRTSAGGFGGVVPQPSSGG
jgi:hypothetical protein